MLAFEILFAIAPTIASLVMPVNFKRVLTSDEQIFHLFHQIRRWKKRFLSGQHHSYFFPFLKILIVKSLLRHELFFKFKTPMFETHLRGDDYRSEYSADKISVARSTDIISIPPRIRFVAYKLPNITRNRRLIARPACTSLIEIKYTLVGI